MSSDSALPSTRFALTSVAIQERSIDAVDPSSAEAIGGEGATLPPDPNVIGQIVTGLIIFGPILGIVAVASGLLHRRVTILDLVLFVIFYAVSGHGLTAGFHRMLTHR